MTTKLEALDRQVPQLYSLNIATSGFQEVSGTRSKESRATDHCDTSQEKAKHNTTQ